MRSAWLVLVTPPWNDRRVTMELSTRPVDVPYVKKLTKVSISDELFEQVDEREIANCIVLYYREDGSNVLGLGYERTVPTLNEEIRRIAGVAQLIFAGENQGRCE